MDGLWGFAILYMEEQKAAGFSAGRFAGTFGFLPLFWCLRFADVFFAHTVVTSPRREIVWPIGTLWQKFVSVLSFRSLS